MADPLKVKQGDRRPYWVGWLEQPSGVPIPNLSQATSLTFKMSSGPGNPLKVNSNAVEILDEPTAKVRYKWQAGDTDQQGQFNVEIEIIWAVGEPMTVPTEGFEKVSITADLDP
jgi:hypothetical protein